MLEQITYWSILLILFPMFLLWVFYRAVMVLKHIRERREFTALEGMAAVVIVPIGYLIDVYCHLVPMTLITLDAPRVLHGEWTVTARFKRYLYNPTEYTWRRKIALWWKPKINRFDPGHLE